MISLIAIVSTVLVTIAFIAIVVWAWSDERKQDFEEASRLPLDDPIPAKERNKRK